MGPGFEVSSERVEKPGIEPGPLDNKASSFTTTPRRLLNTYDFYEMSKHTYVTSVLREELSIHFQDCV